MLVAAIASRRLIFVMFRRGLPGLYRATGKIRVLATTGFVPQQTSCSSPDPCKRKSTWYHSLVVGGETSWWVVRPHGGW